MFTFVLLTALAPAAPEPATGSSPPEQGLAIIDARGNLRLTHAAAPCTYGPANPETETSIPVKRGDEKPVMVKLKITSVMLTTMELPASAVDAYTVDGKRIAAEELASLLKKERTVLIALDGKKVDPFLLELYKEGTIVLVPPANVMSSVTGLGAPAVIPAPIPEAIPVPQPKPLPKPEMN
jgi:hypothetical protein